MFHYFSIRKKIKLMTESEFAGAIECILTLLRKKNEIRIYTNKKIILKLKRNLESNFK